jgi:hypothetical protein
VLSSRLSRSLSFLIRACEDSNQFAVFYSFCRKSLAPAYQDYQGPQGRLSSRRVRPGVEVAGQLFPPTLRGYLLQLQLFRPLRLRLSIEPKLLTKLHGFAIEIIKFLYFAWLWGIGGVLKFSGVEKVDHTMAIEADTSSAEARRRLGHSKPEARRKMGRSRITNGALLFGDGRGPWQRRARDLWSAHLSDLGGPDAVSEAERSIARRAAVLTVECERMELAFAADDATPEALDLYQRTANSLRRMLESLGLQRRTRDVTPHLTSYLEGAYGEAESRHPESD